MPLDAPPTPVPGLFRYVRRRTAHLLGVAGYACVAAPPVALALGFLSNDALTAVALSLVVGLALLWLCATSGRARAQPGTLVVHDDCVEMTVAGHRGGFMRAELVDGYVRAGARASAVLRLYDGSVVEVEPLTASDRSPDAAALVAALGLDAAARAATMSTAAAVSPAAHAAWLYAAVVLVAVALAVALPNVPLLLVLAPGAVAAWVVARANHGPAVTIGVDGLRVGGVVRDRFVAWPEVVDVTIDDGELTARLTNGAVVALGGAAGERLPEARALLARVREARGAGGARPVAAAARHGRPVGEWRAAMRGLLGAAVYRDGAVEAEALEGAVRSGRAAADERVGAALALVASDRAKYATRVRVAAGALADEATRAALEDIAAGEVDDAAVERATRGNGRR